MILLVQNNRKNSVNPNKRKLIAYTNPDSIISEQFRTIITNIKFSAYEQNYRSFLITSPNKGDGKSTSAANLSVSMAQQNKRVLLIDANLRNPSLHLLFKVSNSLGVTNLLSGDVEFTEAVKETGINNLELLTSGTMTSHPVELLGSSYMEQFLTNISESYDVVFIDSPAVLEVTDTKLLASYSDGVILVINQGKTSFEEVLEAKKTLGFANARIIGAILNEKGLTDHVDILRLLKV